MGHGRGVQGRGKGTRRWLWLALGALAAALAVAGGREAWHRPLGPRLVQPVEATVASTYAVISAGSGGSSSVVADAAGGTPGQISEPPETVAALDPDCGAPQLTNILVIGSDNRADNYESGRADFIRAVKVDRASGAVRLLAVPRDLYVSIPLAPTRPIHDRINTAYAYGNLYDVPGGGPSLLAATLYTNFGLTFDHYLVINFQAFVAGIDAIGGVELDLPLAIDGTNQGLRAFPAGPQHLDGAALLEYIRIRYLDSDVHRGQRQDQVIQAIRARVLRPGVVADGPALALALSQLIETDLSPEQVVAFACVAKGLPLEALVALRIGWNQVTPHTTSEGAQVLLPRMDRVMAVVEAFVSGADAP